MNDLIPTQKLAAGTILAASDNTLASSQVRGCTIARTGVGVYTVTVEPGSTGPSAWPAAKDLIVRLASRTALALLTYVRTSNTVITINSNIVTNNAALEADISFEVAGLEVAT